jgi:K(+)-stimulated pyrophosphate-energized sodium pump
MVQIETLGPLSALIAGLLALGFAAYLIRRIMQMDPGTGEMTELSEHTYEGAMTYLNRQYRAVVIFVTVVALAFLVAGLTTESISPWITISFVTGAAASAAAGYVGMGTATRANVRTAQASRTSMAEGLRVAFSSGGVMGMSVVGLGLVGLAITWFWLSFTHPIAGASVAGSEVFRVMEQRLDILAGFAFGASSIALFARVGGGIYTKAADIGADLVGKVESGLPEDDPRNPASIADNVGDNVGDVAGMGADLYESYVNSIVASMVLGGATALAAIESGALEANLSGGWIAGASALAVITAWVMVPLIVRAVGIVAAIVGTFFVRIDDDADAGECHQAFNRGLVAASILTVVFTFGVVHYLLGPANYGIFYAVVVGIAVGLVLGILTEYYTSWDYAPTQEISEQSTTGTATNIISGLAAGLESTFAAIMTIVAGILGAYYLGDIYTVGPQGGLLGIGMGSIGLLSTLGFSLAVDAYGPVADNAGGIVEMAGLGDDIRERTDMLDSVGNTTAAIGKGFAIGSAAFTALALLSAYVGRIESAGGSTLTMSLMDPLVLVGVFIGAMLPFLVSSRTMKAVGSAAGEMIDEVRRQFDAKPELLDEGSEERPDYQSCIRISTESALRQMAGPSLIAIAAPLLVGLLLSPAALGGLLTGAVASGFLMAIFLSNAGGAWDNAKKHIEQGHHGGKGSEAHDAAVVGDTVGDPCKDTSGPSLNILIKLMAVVSLVFAPLFVEISLLAGV